jgi:hypothetical protein
VTLLRLGVTVYVTVCDYAEPKKDARAAAEAGGEGGDEQGEAQGE